MRLASQIGLYPARRCLVLITALVAFRTTLFPNARMTGTALVIGSCCRVFWSSDANTVCADVAARTRWRLSRSPPGSYHPCQVKRPTSSIGQKTPICTCRHGEWPRAFTRLRQYPNLSSGSCGRRNRSIGVLRARRGLCTSAYGRRLRRCATAYSLKYTRSRAGGTFQTAAGPLNYSRAASP